MHPYKELVSQILGHCYAYIIENIPITKNIYVYAMASATSLDPIEIEGEEIILIIKNLGMPFFYRL